MTKLWCYIEGECNIFSVSISPNRTIDALKNKVHDEQQVQCSPSDLILTKVRYIMLLK